MEGVQLKALELLSQMNKNSQISVLNQNPHWRDASAFYCACRIFFFFFFGEKTQNYCVVWNFYWHYENNKNSIIWFDFRWMFPLHWSENIFAHQSEISMWYAFTLHVRLCLTSGYSLSFPVCAITISKRYLTCRNTWVISQQIIMPYLHYIVTYCYPIWIFSMQWKTEYYFHINAFFQPYTALALYKTINVDGLTWHSLHYYTHGIRRNQHTSKWRKS